VARPAAAGFNSWLFATSAGFSPDYFQFPLRQADRIPVFGDCCTVRTSATSTDPVPTNLQIPARPNIDSGVTEYCIDRHQMAVNFVFADGHGEPVPLAELWNLKWSQTFVRKVVLIPAH
jgi:prepilin-type processing-associated H-X9-DG protein